MGWTNWTRKAPTPSVTSDTWLGMDLNSSRLRVMVGDGQRVARAVVLDEPREEFALAAAFLGRTPEFGATARAIERHLPHVFVTDFLKDVNRPLRIEIGRHRLTAADLLAAILQRARALCPRISSVTAVVPPYLTNQKVTIVGELLDRYQFPLRGSVSSPLALVATSELPERRPCHIVVVDCDVHALSISLVQIETRQARLLHCATFPRLNLRVWKDRLLAGMSDRCVRVCRRDPRDSGATEQALFDQLDHAMAAARDGQAVEITVRSSHWYQTLRQAPDELANYCSPLVKATLAALTEITTANLSDPPSAIWLTDAAGQLPGLVGTLETHSAERTSIVLLPADAGCRAALLLTNCWSREDLPRAHRELVISLPEEPIRDGTPSIFRTPNAPPVPRVRKER